MSNGDEVKSVFVLHSRDFKENQAIVEMLVEDEGRISVVTYKGSKRNSQRSALLQPFKLLSVVLQGNGGLRKLKQIDANLQPEKRLPLLQGKALFCGFYLNEILCRLCASDAYFPDTFDSYQKSLKQLANLRSDQPHFNAQLAFLLRRFEVELLSQMGYGLNFETDMMSGEEITDSDVYELFDASGFVLTSKSLSRSDTLLGADIKQLEAFITAPFEQLSESAYLKHQALFRQFKLVMQTCLHRHLGDKPLKSRELFRTS